MVKHVADSLHGPIPLDDFQQRIVDTKCFQRLRNVKQLGLAHYVFPGADYSRFSHSLGVLHITSRILDALESYADYKLEPEERRLYCISALLHDIGHFPFSHTMEHAIEQHYRLQPLASTFTGGGAAGRTIPYVDHLQAGEIVMKWDPSISRILRDESLSGEAVHAVFAREDPELKLAQIISSDLDADRVDFLLRNAHHTGLPYGSVDIDYILTQMRVDKSGRLALTEKALKTADHFLLGRYFDYQQVVYHKTVVAFELVMEYLLKHLVAEDVDIDGSLEWVTEAVRQQIWENYDDAFVTDRIRNLHRNTSDNTLKAFTHSVLTRTPPRLIASYEVLHEPGNVAQAYQEIKRRLTDSKLDELANEFGIDRRLWLVWDSKPKTLTSVGSRVSIGHMLSSSDGDKDKYEQSVRIVDEDHEDGSSAIIMDPRSLMLTCPQSLIQSL